MAYQVTLTELMERARQRANLEGALAFITPPELVGLVNLGVAAFVDEVRGTTWNGTYTRAPHIITTSLNRQTYPLPGDFVALLSVDVSVSAGTVTTARPYQEEERNAYRNFPVLGGWSTSSPIFYQVQGTDISFIPIPQGAYSVTVNYVPTAPVLADPDDSIDSINGWEEFIVLHVAIRMLIKDGQLDVVPVLKALLDDERARIRSLAPRRDMQGAERVHVVQNAGFDDWDY